MIELNNKINYYSNNNQYSDNHDHDFTNPIFEGSKGKYYFRVKEKWLNQSEFKTDCYYQGDLELLFYSMDRPSWRGNIMFGLIRNIKEGYYAKLDNIKQIEIEE